MKSHRDHHSKTNPLITRIMDNRQLAALVKKNAAKAAKGTPPRKGFGKKYDATLKDDPTDEATLKERERSEHFFEDMRKRDF